MDSNRIIKCKVTGIQSYGAFVECGQKKGLIHISELSNFFVANIEDVLALNDEITCYILEEQNNKLKHSLKRIYDIPTNVAKHIKIISGFISLERAIPHFIEKAIKHIKGEKHD